MCIGLWTLEHPDYALILCTNRDEYLNRPTKKAHFHSFGSIVDPNTGDSSSRCESGSSILSGRDIQGGGSWFGINKSGRIALLTNITEPSADYSTSRGSLVSSFLLSQSSQPLEDEIGKIVPQNVIYAGFNLLLLVPTSLKSRIVDGEGSQLIRYESLLVTNHGGGGALTSRSLSVAEKSCGCMSNGIDGAGADSWPKAKQASTDFDAVVGALTQEETTEAELTERLFGVLAWHPEQAIKDRQDVQRTVQVIPVPVVIDGLTANPISTYYGTRLSTVLLVRRDGRVLFIERDIWELGPDGLPFKANPPNERRFHFTVG